MLILLVIGNFLIFSVSARAAVDIYNECSPITEPICQDITYTQTRMYSGIGISSQNEASKRIKDYIPLINIRCSSYLKLFLCSVYFPKCNAESVRANTIVKPCQHLCNHAKQRCEKYMRTWFKLSWPKELDCEQFPKKGKHCLSPDSFNLDEQELEILNEKDNTNNVQKWKNINLSDIKVPGKQSRCLPSEVNIGQTPNISCSQLCFANVQFNGSDKAFASVWLMGWSALCFFSCLLTIIVFSCNTNRFLYPEKPIVFLSICYFFYASGNLLGAILGRKYVACRSYDDHTSFLVDSGRETTWCKINFLMVYFFGSASALWWVVLTITWFLSASRHWGYEAIESISSMLHLLSWAVPALKSVFILILHKIDADELTGQCFVGNTNQNALLGFVIIPHIIYLVIGIVFLTLGYVSLLKVRRSFLQRPDCIDTNNLKRLEKLMAKIGVFSILYIIPVVCTVASYILDAYKMTYFNIVVRALYEHSPECVTKQGITLSMSKCFDVMQPLFPSVEMRMLRIFMNLVVGITSGVWIWGNTKTIRSCLDAVKFWNRNKENHFNLINQCDSVTTPNNIPLSQLKQKESLLPFSDWRFSSPYPSNECGLPSISVPSEIAISPPNNTSISDLSSKH